MATANEIESYKGDSALAGGLGAQNTQYAISGAWKMIDSVNDSFSLLRAQQFQKSQEEYKQKIKDRDDIAKMIESDELNVDSLSDEDRKNANSKIDDLRNNLIRASKDGKLSETATFLELKKQFAEIKGGINNKSVNNIAVDADQKKYGNQFDDRYEAHIAKEKELMASDPNHKYQPYVPIFKYDATKVFSPLVTDKDIKSLNKYKNVVTETPNIAKTFDETGALYTTQGGRKEISSAYDEFTNGGQASVQLLESVNKKLGEIATTLPEDQRALLSPIDLAIDNPATVVAKQRIAMGWDKIDTKPKEVYKDATMEKAYLDELKTDQDIRKSGYDNANKLAIEKLKGKQRERLEGIKGKNAINLARTKSALQKSEDENKARVESKYGKGKKSELIVQTYNAIEKQIKESDILDDNQKISELQKVKNALESGKEYKVGQESPWATLAETMNRLLIESEGRKSQNNKTNNSKSNNITTKSGIVIENVE